MDEYLRISMKPIISSKIDKSKERNDWIQKQIIELTPFKLKAMNLEYSNNKLISENKYRKQTIELKNEEIALLKILNEGLNENMKGHEEYISLLESKLCYVKDFVFRNMPESLDILKI